MWMKEHKNTRKRRSKPTLVCWTWYGIIGFRWMKEHKNKTREKEKENAKERYSGRKKLAQLLGWSVAPGDHHQHVFPLHIWHALIQEGCHGRTPRRLCFDSASKESVHALQDLLVRHQEDVLHILTAVSIAQLACNDKSLESCVVRTFCIQISGYT